MSNRPTVVFASCLAVLAGCVMQEAASNGPGTLTVESAGPSTIRARYSEGRDAIVFRSQLDAGKVVSELYDGAGKSLTALATSVIDREKALQGAGKPAAASRPAPAQIFAEQARLSTALRLYKRALRQLQDKAPATANSPAFNGLRKQLAALRDAQASTHRVLVQQWSAEVARDLSLTADEKKGLAAIYARSAPNSVNNGRGAGAVPSDIHEQLVALLGAERSARFEAHRRNWFARAGDFGRGVTP